MAPLLAAGLLSACADHGAGLDQAITPTEQFPLKVAVTPGEIHLAPHPAGLSAAQLRQICARAPVSSAQSIRRSSKSSIRAQSASCPR